MCYKQRLEKCLCAGTCLLLPLWGTLLAKSHPIEIKPTKRQVRESILNHSATPKLPADSRDQLSLPRPEDMATQPTESWEVAFVVAKCWVLVTFCVAKANGYTFIPCWLVHVNLSPISTFWGWESPALKLLKPHSELTALETSLSLSLALCDSYR